MSTYTRLDSVRPPVASCFRGAIALVGLEPTPGRAKNDPRSGALAALPPPLSGRRSRGRSRGFEFLGANILWVLQQNAWDSAKKQLDSETESLG